MALPIPPDNLNPIPNGPFFYPEGSYLPGPLGPLIVGGGIYIDYTTSTISAGGSGGGGVNTILAGSGIFVSPNVGGIVTVTNTGVLTLTGGGGIAISGSGGNLVITNTAPAGGSGTVTQINTGSGLTGGPITTSGTISLATTAVAPGTYSNPTITVDAYGRITFASPGGSFGGGITATGPIAVTSTFPQNVSIQAASTAAAGAVQLNSTVTSTSNTQAATAGAVKQTYDLASQAATDAANAAASASAAFVQASSAQATANSANINASTALTTALNAQNDATNALSAAAAAQADATTALVASAAAQADATTALSTAAQKIPCAAFTGLGQLLVGTGASTFTTLNPGINGRVLAANSACAQGLEWIATATGSVSSIFTGVGLTGGPITTSGTIALANTGVTPGSYTNAAITVDAQGRITSASSGTAGGVTQIVAGTNVTISPVGGTGVVTINATGGGGGAGTVTSVTAGTGLTGGTITVAGTIGLDDTAVTPGTYNYATVTVDAQGRITSASSGAAPTGTVTNVTATSPILSSGGSTPDISLDTTAVTPGSYTNSSFTVDAYGRLTAASSGTAPVTSVTGTAPIAVTAGTTPVVSIAASSTTASGAVQLYDNVDSTSTTLALTAAQGKVLQDQITGLVLAGTVELAGTIDASVGGILLSVTSVGTADGYVVGNTLPAASATTNNTYVIVTTPGTMTPPGGVATAATRGDWFLVSETSPGVYEWTFLNVGFDVSYATTTSSGVVCLATNAQAQAGVNTITALTPAAAASAYIPKACVTAKGSLITGTAASTPVALPVGTNNQYLMANSACPEGIQWVTGMGDTPVGTVNWFAASAAPVGWLVADGRAVSRTTYSDLFAVVGTTYGVGDNSTTFNLPDLRGMFLRGVDNAGGTARGCDTGRVFGSTQQDAFESHCHGLYQWPAVYTTGSGGFAGTFTNGSCSTCYNKIASEGGTETRPMNVAMLPCIKWQVTTAPSSCGIPCACITAAGTLITGNAANSPVSLAVGANGTALVACSACSEGLTWVNVVPVNATPTTAGVILGCTTSGVAALGCNALGGNAFGALCGHVAIGLCALYSTNSTSYNNIAIGGCSQALTTSGNSNVAIGFCSLALNTTGSGNVAIGDRALSKNTTSGTNTAVGWLALGCFTGTSVSTNDAFGANALPSFICGDYNVSIGGWSLFNAICGTLNTAVGHRALTGVTCANINTAIGFYAGQNITTGCSNVAIGSCTFVANPAGSCQLVIGWAPTCNWLTGDSNKNIRPGAGILDDTGAVGLTSQYLWSTGSGIRWSSASPSDARDKVIHGAIESALPLVNRIEPVSYNWKPRTTEIEEEELVYGFVAQQLQEVDPVLVDSSDPEQLRIYDRKITPLLVRAIQELSEKVSVLQEKLDKLEGNG